MSKEKKKNIILLIIFLVLLVIALGIAYALSRVTLRGEKNQIVRAGNLELHLGETGNNINLTNAFPMTDEEGLATDGYDFTVENTGDFKTSYTIYLEDVALDEGQTRVSDENVKYALTRNGRQTRLDLLSNSVKDNKRRLYVGGIEKGATDTFNLKLWIREDYVGDIAGNIFKTRIRIDASTRPFKAGEENSPELASNMIPVKYNGTNWVKADIYEGWYDYKKQEWANAVTVSETGRSNYLSAAIDTPISMDDINTMWVWIPRYSYTIGSEDGTNYYGKQGDYLTSAPTSNLPGEIDVKFIDTGEKETGSAQYKVSEGISGWRTPDGFTFGDKELPGVWVAKFETSNLENDNLSDNSDLTPIVKPKVASWRAARVSTMETAAMNMTKENNIYGLSSREVDSHMMKNSEWSLAAYLSQSRYGKLGNRSYTGANKEIYINNYNGYKTGCSAGASSVGSSSTCTFEYDNLMDRGSGAGSGGGGASTTGNIYGIYDMSGGSWEYVMGNYNNYSGYSKNGNSGYSGPTGYDNGTFNGLPFPESKYYDLYATNNANTACNGKACTSHALSEVAWWYGDSASMVTSGYPWLVRGGHYGNGSPAGVFLFYIDSGHAVNSYSFRLVLTPQIL